MSDNKVLIAYGTRTGCTEEISQKLAEILEQKGISTDLLDLGNVKSKKWPSLLDYKGVIVGTSIRATMWTKGVKSFLNKNKENLNKNNPQFGMFSVGLFAVTAVEESKVMISDKLKDKHDLEADLLDAFGGTMDLSENSTMGKATKSIMKAAAKGMQEDMGLEFDKEGRNDFRDWDRITKFAEEFAGIL